jgi:predicted esterase
LLNVPFIPDAPPNLAGIPIFVSAGQRDSIVAAANTNRLSEIFESGGAEVLLHWHPGGHELGQDDVEAAKRWIARQNLLQSTRV